jgi:signal peptidase II
MIAMKNPKVLAILTFAGTALAVTALDLWTKEAVFDLLEVQSWGDPPRVGHQVEYTIIPGCFVLQANFNYGAFSGIFSKHTGWLAVLSAAALVAICGIFWVQVRRHGNPGFPLTIALALLSAGTLGNLYDRLFLGAVRDWIKWFYVSGGREHVWPNFNIADSAICVGVGLLVLLEVRNILRERKARKAAR